VRHRGRCRRIERVGHDDAVEAELVPQQAGDDRAGEDGRAPGGVELRIRRVGHHHELHAGRDRTAERRQPHPPEAHRVVVGVLGCGAEPGEVLGRCGDVPGLEPADERGRELRDERRGTRERAAAEKAPRRELGVGNGREVDVDARTAERRRGGPRFPADLLDAVVAERARRLGGRGPGEPANRAAFLVDREEQR
jgi:hypothetical protein